MADTHSLRFIGFAYGAVTAMIGMIAIVVVSGHIVGKLSLDDTGKAAIVLPAAQR